MININSKKAYQQKPWRSITSCIISKKNTKYCDLINSTLINDEKAKQ